MPYWVHGHDRETGAAETFFSEQPTEEAARREATEQGLFIERIVMDGPMPNALPAQAAEPEDGPPADLSHVYVAQEEPADASDDGVRRPASISIFVLQIAEALALLSCGLSLLAIPMVLLATRPSGLGLIYAVGAALSFCYNLALSIVFNYVRKRL